MLALANCVCLLTLTRSSRGLRALQFIVPSTAVFAVQTCHPETVMCLFNVSMYQKQESSVYVVLSTNANILCTQHHQTKCPS